MSYLVVFTTTKGKAAGDRARANFNDRATFEQWHTGEMKEMFEVIEEGITEERADELCPVAEDLLQSSTRFHTR